MSNEQSYRAPRRRGPRGPMGGGMMPGEKAKDFKGTMKKLMTYFFLILENIKLELLQL